MISGNIHPGMDAKKCEQKAYRELRAEDTVASRLQAKLQDLSSQRPQTTTPKQHPEKKGQPVNITGSVRKPETHIFNNTQFLTPVAGGGTDQRKFGHGCKTCKSTSYYQILQNLIKSYQILSNLAKSRKILQNLAKSCKILKNPAKS